MRIWRSIGKLTSFGCTRLRFLAASSQAVLQYFHVHSAIFGFLYNEFGNGKYDPTALEREVARLMADDDVGRKSGIYEYLLSGGESERSLSIRSFTDSQKRAAYERQHGICANCGRHFDFEQMEGDHIRPWHDGGHTTPENLQMLCRDCNRRKGAK